MIGLRNYWNLRFIPLHVARHRDPKILRLPVHLRSVAGNKFLITFDSLYYNMRAATPIFQIINSESGLHGLFRLYPTICQLYQNLFPATGLTGLHEVKKSPGIRMPGYVTNKSTPSGISDNTAALPLISLFQEGHNAFEKIIDSHNNLRNLRTPFVGMLRNSTNRIPCHT